MATQKEAVEFILEKLGDNKKFAARAMFGEYALYAKGKAVALICDDLLYVKILSASAALEKYMKRETPIRAHGPIMWSMSPNYPILKNCRTSFWISLSRYRRRKRKNLKHFQCSRDIMPTVASPPAPIRRHTSFCLSSEALGHT